MEPVVSDEAPEVEEALIYSDYPVAGVFACIVEDCATLLNIYIKVEAILMMPEEGAPDDVGPSVSFHPILFADEYEQHLVLDHGAAGAHLQPNSSIADMLSHLGYDVEQREEEGDED
jgi:hypothetical protein